MSAPTLEKTPITSDQLPTLPSVNLKIFAVELAQWGQDLVRQTGHSAFTMAMASGRAIENTKKAALKPLLPRNSTIGRPFSPLGVGGLTAVIGAGGLLFGHNGMVAKDYPQVDSAHVLSVQANAATSTTVISNDLMVDNAQLHTTIPSNRLRDSVIVHKVGNGETLQQIAQEYNVTVDSLNYVNNLGDKDLIKPGQDLSVLPVSGVLHEVKKGDTLQSIADKWKVPAQAIVDVNWLDEPYQVTLGQKLIIPNAEIPKPTPAKSSGSGLALSPNKGTARGSGRFSWPTSGQVTQYFSYYHNGIDIGAMGAAPPITAADSGVVTFAGWWNGGGGNSVWVDHGNGYVTQYAHMSRISVSVGQSVGRGQQVGIMGNTGMSFGTHLMFNVLINGRAIDPLTVL